MFLKVSGSAVVLVPVGQLLEVDSRQQGQHAKMHARQTLSAVLESHSSWSQLIADLFASTWLRPTEPRNSMHFIDKSSTVTAKSRNLIRCWSGQIPVYTQVQWTEEFTYQYHLFPSF